MSKTTQPVSVDDAVDPVQTLKSSTVQVTVFAGGVRGNADGKGTEAQFADPSGMKLDKNGDLLVADRSNGRIRRITPEGVVSTVAGTGYGYKDGKASEAAFSSPNDVAVDAEGNIYVADSNNHKVRRISPDGLVSTVAGGHRDFANGKGDEGRFAGPHWLSIGPDGKVYVSERWNHSIRKLTPEGEVTTVAGNGVPGTAQDASLSGSRFLHPHGILVMKDGSIVVADYSNTCLRKIGTDGWVKTIAGSSIGFLDGPAYKAKFGFVRGIAADDAGNLYVSDASNYAIRKVSNDGRVTTIFGDGHDGKAVGKASEARMWAPEGLVVGLDGHLYVADSGNNRILKATLH